VISHVVKPNLEDVDMSRREQLEAMLAAEPADTFLRYALAMELENAEEFESSIEMFRGLMQDTPPYVPAFFMLGQLLSRIDRVAEARTVLREGVDQARAQNDLHAAGEMSEFLASLGSLGE
jgi:uncharacterized protein HemY